MLRAPEVDPEARVRLFCFPVSGVGASSYRHWPERLGKLSICPVQLPGRENRLRERPYLSMEDFVGNAVEALGPLLEQPYAVFGHCFGARLGYAFTAGAVGSGANPPEHFFASGCLAPHEGGRFGPYTPQTTDEEYIAGLVKTCEQFGEPVPPRELLALAIRVLRADVELSYGYQPELPVGAPLEITTVGWEDDAHVHPDSMGEWAAYGRVRHVLLKGDESTFRAAPRELLELVQWPFDTR